MLRRLRDDLLAQSGEIVAHHAGSPPGSGTPGLGGFAAVDFQEAPVMVTAGGSGPRNIGGRSYRLETGKKLTYLQQAEVRAAYKPILDDASVGEIVVDLRNMRYIDSVALGMLLMRSNAAAAKGKHIALANARGTVRDIFDIAHFETLFELR